MKLYHDAILKKSHKLRNDDNFWHNVNPVDNSCTQMAERDYLFVCGTLREDIFNSARVLAAHHSAFVGEATFRGRLCDLCGYAGQDGATTQFISSLIAS